MRSQVRPVFSRAIAVIALCSALSALLPQPAFAQGAGGEKAVLAFDLYFDRLAESDLAKETGMDDPTAALGAGEATENTIEPKDLRRLFGAVSAPPSVQSIQKMGSSGKAPLEFNFFVRLQFKDAALAEKNFQRVVAKSEKVTLAGKEFYRPPADEEQAPANMAVHMISDDTMELGTDDYLTLADRNVFSSNLMTAWPKMPRAAIRIAADLDGARHLIDEGLKMGGGVPAAAQPAVSLIGATSTLRLSLDFTGEEMLWLTFTGRDEGSTMQVNGILGGLLAMGKGAGQQFLPMAGPDAQAPGAAILNALVAKQDGNDVNIVLPRPEGLEKAIGSAFGQFMMQNMKMDGGAEFDAVPAGGDDPFGAGPEVDPFGN